LPLLCVLARFHAPRCAILQKPEPSSNFAFAKTTITALSYAREALDEAVVFEGEHKNGDDTLTGLISMMIHTKAASQSFECAEAALQPYKDSRDRETIGSTADYLATIHHQHILLNGHFLDTLRKLPDLSSQPTKLADIVSTIVDLRGKLWDSLTEPTTLVLLNLIDRTRADSDGILRTLVITRAERGRLLTQLLQTFPQLKEGPTSRDLKPIEIARLYYLFLTKGYKGSDERAGK
jgi:hypothetical protein